MAQSKSIYFQCVHTQECTQNEHGQGNPCWMEQLWLPQPSSIKRSSDRCRRQYFAHCWVKGYWKGKLHVIWARPLFPVKESQRSPSETSQGSTTLVRYCLLKWFPNQPQLWPPPAKNETVQQKECEGKKNERSSSQQPFTCPQDAYMFMQQPFASTPMPLTQLQNTTDVTDDQSQLKQISEVYSSYSLIVLIILFPHMTCSGPVH